MSVTHRLFPAILDNTHPAVSWFLLLLLLTTNSPAGEAQIPQTNEFTILVAGDAIITQPWSTVADDSFEQLVGQIRAADVAITNLELVLTDYNGFPQADSGGTYLSARPGIAAELAWAGFDMVSTANNHAFDYGSIGVLETLTALHTSRIAPAGTGIDLQSARQPGYFKHQHGTVALIAATSSFVPYGIAGKSRPDIRGRPGLNPLRVSVDGKAIRLLNEIQRNIQDLLGVFGVSIGGIDFRTIDSADRDAILDAIRHARSAASFVVVSVHAHNPGPWLEDLFHTAIDTGAQLCFSHGPHTPSGIEIYRGHPIFYGLGNFVFQREFTDKLPAEAYEKYRLGPEATPRDYFRVQAEKGLDGFLDRPEVWESIIATATFIDRRLRDIQIIPIDLGFHKAIVDRGRPGIAMPERGRRIIEDVAAWSRRFGTQIRYSASDRVGIVPLAAIHPD